MKKRPHSKKQARKKNLVYLGVTLLVVCAVMVGHYLTRRHWWSEYNIQQAVITDIHHSGLTLQNSRWVIVYQYTAYGKTYHSEDRFFNETDFGDWQIGDTITIRVSRKDPDVSEIDIDKMPNNKTIIPFYHEEF